MPVNGILGEVALFPYGFAPEDWARCDGSVLSISANSALYSVIGSAYGGDEITTFALPDLRGCVPIGYYGSVGVREPRGAADSGHDETVPARLHLDWFICVAGVYPSRS